MPLPFYQSTHAHSLFNYNNLSTVNHASNTSPDKGLPTLAVVLGLIGVLAAIALISGVCIHIFRRRLFPLPAGPADDEEKLRPESETKEFYDHLGNFSPMSGDTIVSISQSGVEASKGNIPQLQPFSFNPAKPASSHYKSFLVSRLWQAQTDLVDDSTAQRDRAEVSSNSLKVSQSCPANIGQPASLSQITSGSAESELQRLVLGHGLLPQPPPLMYSYESMSSVHSAETVYSSSTSESSVDWDYYLNDRHEGLFYEPPSPSPPSFSSSLIASKGAPIPEATEDKRMGTIIAYTSLEFVASSKTGRSTRCTRYAKPLSKRTDSVKPNSKRLHSKHFRSYEARRQCASRSQKLFKLRRGVAKRYLAAGSDRENIERIEWLRGSHRRHTATSNNDSRAGAKLSLRTCSGPYLERTPPRTSSMNALDILHGSPLSVMSKHLCARQELASSPATLHQQPSFLLNDIPTNDFTTPPSRIHRLASPPRNPELLNTRWIPRPTIPQLNITVFAKRRSTPPSSSQYPGRRVTVTPPAGTSLVELRGRVERALEHEITALRGMVFIGTRSMFLPLVSERFYAQWVKERVRDGGTGIVQALHS